MAQLTAGNTNIKGVVEMEFDGCCSAYRKERKMQTVAVKQTNEMD
jgi:hypothetical protein